MSRRDCFDGEYEVADGYAGGRRPQYFTIDAMDVEPEATEAELTELFEDEMQAHFRANIEPSDYANSLREFLAWARGKQEAAK